MTQTRLTLAEAVSSARHPDSSGRGSDNARVDRLLHLLRLARERRDLIGIMGLQARLRNELAR